MTLAPNSFATWMAAMPMPPAAPWISTHSPACIRPALQQRVIRGGVGAAEHTGLRHAQAGGHEVAQRGLGVAQFGAGAEAVAAHDRIARLKPVTPGPTATTSRRPRRRG